MTSAPIATSIAASASEEDVRRRWEIRDADDVSRREVALEQIRGHRPRPAKLDLRGIRLVREDLQDVDLSHADLTGADLSGANLRGALLFSASLKDAVLLESNLEDAELTAADLSGANLQEAAADRAGFGSACLRNARLFHAGLTGATFTKANLDSADLRLGRLQGARLREANLRRADFSLADLRDSDLQQSSVRGASFREADLRGIRLRGVTDYERCDWVGADFRDIDFTGAYFLRRFALDQNYLHEFRNRNRMSRWVYHLWWATSDCGRSLPRWAALTLIVAAVFAILYSLVEIDFGHNETWLSPLYFSVVTLTTLGYGDVVPVSAAAQSLTMIQVVCGYFMLGGLLCILSNKMGRRAD